MASPERLVLACTLDGNASHVLPLSVLYSQSYAACGPADTVVTFTEPETAPCLIAKTCGLRLGVLRTARPAPRMTVGAVSPLASATLCTYALNSSSSLTSAERLSSRAC